ncbi:MAG: CPBP family glutamic-type intramembrane protease [Blastocatellia bacterium]
MKPHTWPPAQIFILLSLWLALDYRWYALVWRRGYPVMALLLVVVGLWLAARQQFSEVRLRWPRTEDWKIVLVTLAVLAVLLIPLGLALDFIHFAPAWPHLRRALLETLPIWLIVALPEEIIFRGMIQKTVQDRSGSTTLAVTVASVLFGLAHLHKGSPLPNWRYALLAALAGAGYGLAFRRCGLMASSMTHALLDAIWRAFFRFTIV